MSQRPSQIANAPEPASIQDGSTLNDMSHVLLAPLNEMQGLLNNILLSLTPPQQQNKSTLHPPSIEAFLACDDALINAVSLATSHQVRQRRIDSLKAEILDLNTRWRNICIELQEGKADLRTLLNEADERQSAIEDAKKASIPYPELLVYAQSLSAFTSAPPNMPDMSLPGQPPPPLFFPPFPNEEKMRRGRLNAEAPLGSAGETHSVGRPPSASPKGADMPHTMHGANPYRHDHRPQQALLDLDFDLDLNPDL